VPGEYRHEPKPVSTEDQLARLDAQTAAIEAAKREIDIQRSLLLGRMTTKDT
jgi:hypothetical protein